MIRIWDNIRFFVDTHRIASIATASVVGIAAVGGGGYAAYNAFSSKEPEVETVKEEKEKVTAGDVYIPEFKNVILTSESIEKDITIYISEPAQPTEESSEGEETEETSEETSEGEGSDVCVTGVPFQVKLVTPENAETLQSYVEAIEDLDRQIDEYREGYDESATIQDILADRNIDVTITDENNEVVDTDVADVTTDPLYSLCLDKETAVQAYTVALNQVEGVVYTDEDEDGIITETDVTPGDYVLCLVNSLDEGAVNYTPDSLTTPANVKDKVEYKVQKEIQKQIKKDVASEDGQKEEAAPVEATLTDTVEFVESKKVENGASYKETTDAVAPKTTADSSKATAKAGGVTKVYHDAVKTASRVRAKGAVAVFCGNTYTDRLAVRLLTRTVSAPADGEGSGESSGGTTDNPPVTDPDPTPAKYKITVNFVDGSGKSIADSVETDVEEGKNFSYTAPSTIGDYTLNDDATKSITKVTKADSLTFKYKEKETSSDTPSTTPTANKYQITVKFMAGDTEIKAADTKEVEENKEFKYTADKTITKDGVTYNIDGSETQTIAKVTKNETVTFKYKKAETATTVKEEATLDMSYSKGTFTITASANVGSVKVNGTDVKMENGKGTYKATKDGEYKLTGVATFSDKKTDNTLTITYTVSGFGTASTDKLKDSKGNQLYLDAEGKKEATAADYEKGKKYYYKEASYTYYGWQGLAGGTRYYDKNGNYVTGEQIIQGVKYNFGTDGYLVVNGLGIDVSKHQGSIDWSQAGPAVSFAIVRCGYRGMYDGQLHEDPYFYKNMSGAKSNGVTTGIYIYSTALNEAEAVAEASMAVSMANKAGGCSLPIYIDMEDSVRGQKSLSNDQRNAIINAFCSTVQSAGYKAGVYANKTWMTQYINASALPSSCHIWVAQYNTTCTYNGRKSMWQYSSKGSIPGIKGNVDVNKSYF